MGDDSIDTVILQIDMGYLVTRVASMTYVSLPKKSLSMDCILGMRVEPPTRGLHSSTSQLNLSRL